MMSASQIRSARLDLGETQTKFARRLRVDQSTISRWEKEGISDRLTALAVRHLLDAISEERAA